LERDKDNANMYKYLAWLVVVGESKQASRLAQYHGVAAPAVSWCLNNFCPDLQHLLDISVRAAYPPSHSTAGHILYIRRLNRIIVLTYTRCMVIWKQEALRYRQPCLLCHYYVSIPSSYNWDDACKCFALWNGA
jgi:hypothetical protein